MLTFEKVLEVFQAYLDDDPLYEVVQTCLLYTSPVIHPFQCFRMRGAAKRQEETAFRNSFGLPDVYKRQAFTLPQGIFRCH